MTKRLNDCMREKERKREREKQKGNILVNICSHGDGREKHSSWKSDGKAGSMD